MLDPEFHSPRHALTYHMKKKGVSAYQIAKETLLVVSKISEINSGKRRITTETATVLGAYFGTGTEYWTSIQMRADLHLANAASTIPYSNRGEIAIGGKLFRCFVLPDEARVVSALHFFIFFGINSANQAPTRLASIIDNPVLQSARMDEVRKKLERPLRVADSDGAVVLCYEGDLIVDFCKALLDVRRIPDALPKWAEPFAQKAEIAIVSLAGVGITALIDEATGHQANRHREALQRLLDAYFRKEKYGAWSKRFPDWYYQEIFRLKGWQWDSLSNKRPPYVGKITKDIVYSRMEPGVIEELERRNPTLESGTRKVKHHQWLTDEIGHPALDRHFYALRGLFRASTTWDKFHHSLTLAHPRQNELVQLELDDQLDD